jgi:hypothetical protein
VDVSHTHRTTHRKVVSRGAEEQGSRGAEEQRSRGAKEQRNRGSDEQWEYD